MPRLTARIIKTHGDPWTHVDLRILVDGNPRRRIRVALDELPRGIQRPDLDDFAKRTLQHALRTATTETVDDVNAAMRREDR